MANGGRAEQNRFYDAFHNTIGLNPITDIERLFANNRHAADEVLEEILRASATAAPAKPIPVTIGPISIPQIFRTAAKPVKTETTLRILSIQSTLICLSLEEQTECFEGEVGHGAPQDHEDTRDRDAEKDLPPVETIDPSQLSLSPFVAGARILIKSVSQRKVLRN